MRPNLSPTLLTMRALCAKSYAMWPEGTLAHTLREGNQEPTTKKPGVDDTKHNKAAGHRALVSKNLTRPSRAMKMS